MTSELPVIQKTYDFIKWYVPILNRLPHSHKFILGERITTELYELLEGLINARYSRQKLPLLESLNINKHHYGGDSATATPRGFGFGGCFA